MASGARESAPKLSFYCEREIGLNGLRRAISLRKLDGLGLEANPSRASHDAWRTPSGPVHSVFFSPSGTPAFRKPATTR